MASYGAIIGFCWLAFVLAWVIAGLAYRDTGRNYNTRGGSGLRNLLAVGILVAIGYGQIVRFQPFGEYAADFAAAGVALCVVGLVFAIWARVALGSNWGMPMTEHESPELVTSGPYRLVRHPIYTGGSAMMIGTALVHPLAVLPCVFFVWYSVASALREERDMDQRFPTAYADYRKRSKMLVPFLF